MADLNDLDDAAILSLCDQAIANCVKTEKELETGIRTVANGEKRRRKVVIDWQCINPRCHVFDRAQLRTARDFVVRFFGANVDTRKKRKVCKNCAEEAEACSKDMARRLLNGESCFPSRGQFPLPCDMVSLDDSDDEEVTDSSSESDLEIEIQGENVVEDETVKNMVKSMVTKKFKLPEQVSQAMDSVRKRTDGIASSIEENDELFANLEKEVVSLSEALYEPFRAQTQALPSVNLDSVKDLQEQQLKDAIQSRLEDNNQKSVNKEIASVDHVLNRHPVPQSLPPHGTLKRPLLQVGQPVFAMRGNILNVWRLGNVARVDIAEGKESEVKVRFEARDQSGKLKSTQVKVLIKKHLAYSQAADVRLQVGTRVIALYRDHASGNCSEDDFYSGIVAEPPKIMNKYRYLIFFDDGYASYISHGDIRVVLEQSKDVWEDIHPNSREFVKKYLKQYPERPMVKLYVAQVVRTEWEGKWWITQVLEVDASLVKLQFKTDGRTEWVYRGSTRLGPLFLEMQQQRARKEAQSSATGSHFASRRHLNPLRKSGPYVEYTRQSAMADDEECSNIGVSKKKASNVARKSTGPRRQQLDSESQSTDHHMNYESRGEIRKAKVTMTPGKLYVPHECSPGCIEPPNTYNPDEMALKKMSPLLVPVVLGWKRQLTRHKNQGRRTIFYVAPCGRRLRSIDEVHRYLSMTRSTMTVDMFNFEWYVHVLNEFVVERDSCNIPDLSYGKENVPVQCVNSVDRSYPEYVEYSCERLPSKGVHLNTEEDFLVCCDCLDDCQDKTKCACCKLTVESTAASPDGRIDPNAGYVFRRLKQQVPTGIFECNSKCKCNKTCLNRVAQNPLRYKLQVFKTEKRGWGIRTLCDIPEGAFICIYVGNLYSNTESNQVGQNYGDEYFAELDLIETLEKNKEGYESDCEDISDCEVLSRKSREDDEDQNDDADYEDSASTEDDERANEFAEDARLKWGGNDSSDRNMRSRTRKRNLSQGFRSNETSSLSTVEVDGEKHRQLKDFGTKTTEGPEKAKEKTEKRISTRKLFGKEEDVYVMDAKSKGNIGRYLNHSCSPNVFVQNCFVDTHDLRFPWLAFFASNYIRAGQELCWDYHYIIGQVEGKEIYCFCGADNCRGRLL